MSRLDVVPLIIEIRHESEHYQAIILCFFRHENIFDAIVS